MANLAVLQRHWSEARGALRRRDLRMGPYMVRKFYSLGDRAERAGEHAEVRRWYLRALGRQPGLPPLDYQLRCVARLRVPVRNH